MSQIIIGQKYLDANNATFIATAISDRDPMIVMGKGLDGCRLSVAMENIKTLDYAWILPR